MLPVNINISPSQLQPNYLANGSLLNNLLQNQYQTQMMGAQSQIMPQDLQAKLAYQLLQNQNLKTVNQFQPQDLAAELQKMQLGNQQMGIVNQYLGPQLSLANQTAATNLKYLPQSLQASIALKNAQVPLTQAQARMLAFKLQNPLLSLPGPAGQIGAMNYLSQTNPNLLNSVQNAQNGSPYATNQQNAMPSANDQSSAQTQMGIPYASGMNAQQMGNQPTQMPMQQNLQSQPINGASAVPGFNNLSLNPVDMIRNSLLSDQAYKIGRAQYYKNRSTPYANATPEAKQYMIGMANSMGYQPDQAIQALNNGQTLQDLADNRGLNLSNISPSYNATTSSVSNMQQRMVALNEINSLSQSVRAGLGPYSQTLDGYSPKQVYDIIKGLNPDQQAQYLAAYALLPELAGARGRAATGGRVGIETLNEISDKSYGDLKAFRGMALSPDVFDKTQQLIDQNINNAVQSAQKGLYNTVNFNPQNQGINQNVPTGAFNQPLNPAIGTASPVVQPNMPQSAPQASNPLAGLSIAPNGRVRMINSKTGQRVTIRPDQLDLATKSGYVPYKPSIGG